MAKLAKEASEEEDYKRVLEALKEGWKVDKLPSAHPARELASQWANISVETFSEGGLAVIEGTKILIPATARKRLIEELHQTCMSGKQMWPTVKGCWYWPGLKRALSEKEKHVLHAKSTM